MTGPDWEVSSSSNGRSPPRPPAGATAPPGPPEDDWLRFWQRTVQIFIAVVVALVALLGLLHLVALVSIIGPLLAASAVVQLGLLPLERREWVRNGVWLNPAARREVHRSMVRRTLLLGAVIALALGLGVSVITLAICAGIFAWVPSEWMELKRRLPAVPFLVMVDLAALMGEGQQNGNGQQPRRVYDQQNHEPLPRLVRRRLWRLVRDANGVAALAASLAGLSAVLCTVTLAAGIGSGHLHVFPSLLRGSPSTSTQAQAAGSQAPSSDEAPAATKPSNPDSGASPSRPETVPVSTECPALTTQAGIPEWAHDAIEELYRGPQSLGPEASGCPSTIHEKITPHGLFVWALGEGAAGQLQSVAVASRGLEDAIFISPAAEPVLKLIETIGAVGGPQRFPRYRAGTGDYYILNTEHGTYLLMREESGTSETAMPYVELAPAAATALIAADRELRLWLWPTITPTGPDRDVIALRSSPDGPIRARIVYYPRSGTAERAPYPVYERDQAQLSAGELQQLAPVPARR